MKEYHLEVYGYLWSGARSVYSYALDGGQGRAIAERKEPFASADAKRCAGDFESLIDWRLVRHTFRYEKTSSPPIARRIDEYRTLRGFRAGMTPAKFYRMANGG